MVHGDNIYLRELQNFFFEVLGMMSITHYGAIGDGRTDNYGPLQVAIDDAHRRGLSFLYVPFGRFIYTGELINIGDIIFMGNPHAHIVNVRTGEEIEIHQFGWFNGDGNYYTKEEADGRFVNISGDTMTGPLAIGGNSTASGTYSFAQGEATASGGHSNASGYQTIASDFAAHAEGFKSTASGNTSHAEGDSCVASGITSHAENSHTTASGHRSHAEGWYSVSSNHNAHAEGYGTAAQGRSQHAEGEWNVIDTTAGENSEQRGAYIHIAGNGSYVDEETQNRSNAYTLDWGGNGWFAGDVYVGSNSGTNKDAGSKKLATEEYVDTHGGSGNVVSGSYIGSSSETTITASGLTTIKYATIVSADEKLTATITPNGDAVIARGENVSGVTEKVMAYHLSSVTISGNTITISSTSMLNEDQYEYYYMIVG